MVAGFLMPGAGFGFSCDAEEYAGMHWVSDDLCYYELVDPETKQPIPIENGAKGEALFTMLKGDGFVWIRQGMGDIHQVLYRAVFLRRDRVPVQGHRPGR